MLGVRSPLREFRICLLAFSVLPASCAQEAMRTEMRATIDELEPGASATIQGITMTVNRKQVATQDADGWYPAESAEGKFRVRMPIPFNDFSASAPVASGAPFTYDAIGGKSLEGARFRTICFRFEAGGVPKDWVMETRRGLAQKLANLRFAPVKVKGLSAERLDVETPEGLVYAGLLIVGANRACQVSAEFPKAHYSELADVADAFLGSFEFVASSPN